MATILDNIVQQTRVDLKKRKQRFSLKDLETLPDFERPRRSLKEALTQKDTVAIIAEIKKASPSKGIFRNDFDPEKIAFQYQKGGASALSVLTDEPAFKGSLEYLKLASNKVDIPLLRKDFIVDTYQIQEARAYGADAVLLIATITDGQQLQELQHAAEEAGLECLVECYSEDDFKQLNVETVDMLGVNNRDLHTFAVDVHRGIDLLQKAPPRTTLVSESGIGSAEDLKLLCDEHIDAALIGEHFMRQTNPGQAVEHMLVELSNLMKDDA